MGVALKPNTLIGGLTLIDVIGRGGFGITYKAVDTKSKVIYAVKEYLPDGMSERDALGRVTATAGQGSIYERGLDAFMTEANILKDLPRRQGLVRVRGAFQKFGTAYCVMEYIEGDSLDRMAARIVKRFGQVPADLVSELAVSTCWALSALHAEKLIHRDVKPGNIMVRKSGQPVLIDFGAARRLSRRGVKEIIFTRKYAAIEQFPPELNGFGREFEEGAWSDIYSLSVVLYDLVAQVAPPDAAERAISVLGGTGDPYRELASNPEFNTVYPVDLLSAIDEGCKLMPKERFQTAEDFARRIDPDRWDSFAQAEVAQPAHTTSVPLPEKSRKGRAWLMFLFFLISLSAGAAYWYYRTYYSEVF